MNSLVLSKDQKSALDLFNDTDHNLFITGQAGTGKSFLIKKLTQKLDRKIFPVLSTTGTAAVLINGRTFHSFFGLGILEGGIENTVSRALSNRSVISRVKKITGFILDEVSMLDTQAMITAEMICREIKENDIPWGGLKLVFVGDFFQLPPVSHTREREWVFNHPLWNQTGFIPIILKEIIRSKDAEYLKILHYIRNGIVNDDVKYYLDDRIAPNDLDSKITRLFSRRNQMQKYNEKHLMEVDEPLVEFKTEYAGRDWAIDKLKKQAPIEDIIRVKKFTKVMIRVNDPKYHYVNGSVGNLIDIDQENLVIELKNGKIIDLKPTTFSWLDPSGEVIAAARNFPINLAYATTIHKSQGMTLDELVVDLKNLWEPGQAYVALSRLKSGNGLYIKDWDEKSILVDEEVVGFYETLSLR
jgi:ATP-dependent exoDNAse (exonuclease V) alpha subunit